jgi:hypothetical protein
MNNPIDIKENDKHALDFVLLAFFVLCEFGLSEYGSALFTERWSYACCVT